MTARELLKKVLDLPVPLDEATITFQDGKLSVSLTKSDEYGSSGEVYVIE